MRKYVVLAVAALASMVFAGYAQAAGQVQSIEAAITPTKLDKKKKKPVKLFVDIITQNNSEAATLSDQPPSASRTVVDFPKNLSFDTKAVPTCKVSSAQLQNTTTETATSLCGAGSIVSIQPGTSALIKVDVVPTVAGTNPLQVPVVVTAFNGFDKDTLYLHARADSVNNTSVLIGKLKKGPSGYGKSLDVTVPPLMAGGIADFRVTVKAGKYIRGVCKSKTNKFQATTTFGNWTGGPTNVDTDETTCKRKKSKKKKK